MLAATLHNSVILNAIAIDKIPPNIIVAVMSSKLATITQNLVHFHVSLKEIWVLAWVYAGNVAMPTCSEILSDTVLLY